MLVLGTVWIRSAIDDLRASKRASKR